MFGIIGGRRSTRQREDLVLAATTTVVAVISVTIATQWFQGKESDSRASSRSATAVLPGQPLTLTGANTIGSRTATVAIIEFSDFQCPFCGLFARQTLPGLDRDFIQTGLVLFAFRNLPLTSVHPLAQEAAEGAICAGRQGKFWEMHDSLFGDQKHLDRGSILLRADALELRTSAFVACLDGGAADAIQEDHAAAEALAIDGTPTFFLGPVLSDGRVKIRNVLSGSQPLAQFEGALATLLAQFPATNK
jgi:protein-disulfide isomerase